MAQANALISSSRYNPAQIGQLKEKGGKDNEITMRGEESILLPLKKLIISFL